MADEIINKDELIPLQDNKEKGCKKEAVLYMKRAFSPVHNKLITTKKFKLFSPAAIANDIKKIKSNEMTKNIIKDANSAVAKQRSTKNRWLSAIFLVINIIVLIVVLYFQLSKEDSLSLSELLNGQINWGWLLMAFAFVLFLNIADGLRVWVLIKFSTGRSRPWLSLKSISIQKFYDVITPLATGGQPFQVFYLNKRGLPASSATSIPLAKYLYNQIIFLILAILVLTIKHTQLISLPPFISTLCIIGLILNLSVILLIMFLSISKKAGPSFAIGILKLGYKLHLVKDYRRTYVKVMKMVREYVATSRVFMSNAWIVISEAFLSILTLLFHYSLPFFIFCGLGGNFDLNIWLDIVAMTIICDLAVSFVPVPGGAGMAELSFSTIFATYFNFTTGSVAGWAVLIWRFLTYYIYLLWGILVMFYDFSIGNKKIQPLLDKFKTEEINVVDKKTNKKIKQRSK